MSSTSRPVPITDDHDTGPLYAAAARGELAVRVCECGVVSHLPVSRCRHCGSTTATWQTVSGGGRVVSWTTVVHPTHPAFPTPYTVVLVALEEHPQVHHVGHVAGEPAIEAGQAAAVWFEEIADGVVIPQWRLIERGDDSAGRRAQEAAR